MLSVTWLRVAIGVTGAIPTSASVIDPKSMYRYSSLAVQPSRIAGENTPYPMRGETEAVGTLAIGVTLSLGEKCGCPKGYVPDVPMCPNVPNVPNL
jgi:hypothetical protein